MLEVNIGMDLVFEASDQVGVLAKICKAFAKEGVNIQAVGAQTRGGKGFFTVLTDNNPKALEALKKLNIDAKEREVVLLELENEIGALAEVSATLADTGINISSLYASAGESYSSLIVLCCDDNAKAVAALG